MKKILIVFGTRPEAIKMIPVYNALKKRNVDVKICVTAQHRQMLDQVLNFFKIKPDFDLNLMKQNQSLVELSAQILINVTTVLKSCEPDIVLVHGDTTTSMMASLAAYHMKIFVGHIEAGLRTYDKYSPFPEEMNRQIISKIAEWHFSPTPLASKNLLNEQISEDKIVVTGNTVIDAMLEGVQLLQDYSDNEIQFLTPVIENWEHIILVTGHRRENFGEGIKSICEGLREIAKNNSDCLTIYPVHLNPNIQAPVNEILGGIKNISLVNPLGYPAFLWLMSKSSFILTDSGGIQEEAPSLKKPVLVMRDITERMEAIESGTAKLVGTNKELIYSESSKLLSDKTYYKSFIKGTNPYGDGQASRRIAEFLLNVN